MRYSAPEPLPSTKVIQKRADYLRALTTPASKPGLEQELDRSRSAVNYAIRELEDHALVQRTADGFELTLLGRLAYQSWSEYSADVSVLFELAPILDPLPADSLDTMTPLRGAEATFSEPADPDSAFRTFREWLLSTDELKLSLPCIDDGTIDELVDCDARSIALVLPEATVRALLSGRSNRLEALVDDARLELFQTQNRVPIGVSVGNTEDDSCLALSFFSDAGHLTGVVLNDATHAASWGDDVFSSRRACASLLA